MQSPTESTSTKHWKRAHASERHHSHTSGKPRSWFARRKAPQIPELQQTAIICHACRIKPGSAWHWRSTTPLGCSGRGTPTQESRGKGKATLFKARRQNKMITPVLGHCLLREIQDDARGHHVEQNDHLLPGAVQLPAQSPQVPRQ